ncbi:MAG: hypothetical protein M3N18_05070, partial [Actinomycetota bacterium]|nr:hypothetical protein [Actinomycetota bacterium]
MAKRLVVLVGMLAVLLAVAAPVAFAQQGPITATGVVGEPFTRDQDPEPIYPITDEGRGTPYELISGFVDLEPYVGERVTIEGVPVPGPGAPGAPRLLNVTQLEPAGTPPPGPSPERTATLSFELTVEGEPPAGTRFFGAVPAEGCISAPLTDPDGDGVFTGSVDVPRFPPGPVPPDAKPVSLPVRIVQADSGMGPCNPTRAIKNFGEVKIDGDETFETSVSFPEGPGGSNDTVTVTFELTIDGDVPDGKFLSVDTGIEDVAQPVFCSTADFDRGSLPVCEDGETYSDTFETSAGSRLSYEYAVFD